MNRSVKVLSLFAAVLMALLFAPKVYAVPIASIGAGSAVTSVHATAEFEDQASLFGNPYTENGLEFSRTGLSFNNNSCGYAGCQYWFAPFGGSNYMYGTGGSDGKFYIKSTGGNVFQGLEFQVSNGYTASTTTTAIWSTWLNGIMTGSGSMMMANWSVFGIMDLSGFDELQFTDSMYAPAFDHVNAQYTGDHNPVPEPSTYLLLGSGIAGLAMWRRKRKLKG